MSTAFSLATAGILFALALPACGPSDGGGSGGSAGSGDTSPGGSDTGTLDACPGPFPDGESCSVAGLTCQYTVGDCPLTYVCTGGTFVIQPSDCASDCDFGLHADYCLHPGEPCVVADDCNIVTDTCAPDHTWDRTSTDYPDCGEEELCPNDQCHPFDEIAEGAPCDPCDDAFECQYILDAACGPDIAAVTCEQGVFHILDDPTCECSAHATAADCQADAACRWLSPGCDIELDTAACFPAADCLSDLSCLGDAQCWMLEANTCDTDGCVECHTVHVCL